jgi:hypothetical protein
MEPLGFPSLTKEEGEKIKETRKIKIKQQQQQNARECRN